MRARDGFIEIFQAAVSIAVSIIPEGEDTALHGTPMATPRAALETLAWADFTLYHSWRLIESLRIASAE